MGANRAKKAFECKDTRYCFAYLPLTGLCGILDGKEDPATGEIKTPYADGQCPFCKPEQNDTNGVYYPCPRDMKLPMERRRR